MSSWKYSGFPTGPVTAAPTSSTLKSGGPEPVINWKKDSAFKVTIGDWEITSMAPKELSLIHIRFPERGLFLLSIGDHGWECAYTNSFGRPKTYSQADSMPPINKPLPLDAAQYIQKAHAAMDFVQQSDRKAGNENLSSAKGGGNRPGFRELEALKTQADSVIASAQARGLTLETQLHMPQTLPPAKPRMPAFARLSV